MTGTGAPAASGESRRPALRQALSTPESKGRYVRRLFSTIADRYDLITVLLSGGLDIRWKRALVALADVTAASDVLDLACPDWDDYRRAMVDDRRLIVRLRPERAYGMLPD